MIVALDVKDIDATKQVRIILPSSVCCSGKRKTTPRDAVLAGADYLVVGRPITGARDLVAAAKEILDQMQSAFDERGVAV